MNTRTWIAPLFALQLLTGLSAFADETSDSKDKAAEESCRTYMKERWKDWSFGFGLSYVANNGASAESAFTGASLAAPTRDLFGFRGEFTHNAPTGLELGFQFASFSTKKEDGLAEARVMHGRFGGFIGYKVFRSGMFTTTIGSAVGFASSYVSVFSTPLNGKKQEYSGYVEPSVKLQLRVSEWLSLALESGYVMTLARSDSSKGASLGTGVLSPQGFGGSFLFVLGKAE